MSGIDRARWARISPLLDELLDVDELRGQVVGNYTLDRPLGQGGMGSVWLVHRSHGRFEGLAAIKFLNLSLLGQAGIARFRREGQVLARLTHPNVARLLDAGIHGNIQPYLIIEYVDGEPIDHWCDKRGLDVKDPVFTTPGAREPRREPPPRKPCRISL